MFKGISKSFAGIFQKWKNGIVSEKEIQAFLQDIRLALIDADAAVEAVDNFIEIMKSELLQHDFLKGANMQQQLQAKVHNVLVKVLGDAPNPVLQIPGFILLAGLQGAGKTTTAVKLAFWIKNNQSMRVAVTSVDFQRPAAREQLKILSEKVGITYLHVEEDSAKNIFDSINEKAKIENIQVVIVDTAGRLHIDQQLMSSLKELQTVFNPKETIFVLDSQTGQDAARSAVAFNEALSITSCILTKCDADSKSGAALSLRSITKKPISFIGIGEKIENLKPFDPENIANRMLDLGDVSSLIEDLKKNINQEEAKKQAKKMASGHYDLSDFLAQLQQLKSMGGVRNIVSMLPGAQSIPDNLMAAFDEETLRVNEIIILSMTKQERQYPNLLLQPSRRDRIIKGSGRSKIEFGNLMKQYNKMQDLIKKLSGSKIKMMMDMMKQFGAK